jgi:hypothetical protein
MKFGRSALYERIIQEKVRQIDILAEQIEYLRAQLALRGTFVPGAAVNPTEQPARGTSFLPLGTPMEVKNHVSDEELDLEALLESGEADESMVKEIMGALGLEAEVDLDNWNVN